VLRIALVEDNPADAHLMETALRQTGETVEVQILQDGLEAIQNITEGRNAYDLILLDLNLPRRNGFEVLESLRRLNEFKGLPIIIMSGSSDPADIERCYRAGCNSYVCKPAHLEEIFVTARQLLTYWTNCAKLPPRRLTGVGTAQSEQNTAEGCEKQDRFRG
jgi:CheY-like chemotaxis protein